MAPALFMPSLRCKLVIYCAFSTLVCELAKKLFRELILASKVF